MDELIIGKKFAFFLVTGETLVGVFQGMVNGEQISNKDFFKHESEMKQPVIVLQDEKGNDFGIPIAEIVMYKNIEKEM